MIAICNHTQVADRKIDEGKSHPDHDAQFNYIQQKMGAYQKAHQPVISVDAKKKELIGNYKNGGVEWQEKKRPVEVKVYDFLNEAEGRAIPYGVYDITQNQGWVNVGIDKDTAEFAVQTIRNWWYQMGRERYPAARQLLITADGGGSNGGATPKDEASAGEGAETEEDIKSVVTGGMVSSSLLEFSPVHKYRKR